MVDYLKIIIYRVKELIAVLKSLDSTMHELLKEMRK